MSFGCQFTLQQRYKIHLCRSSTYNIPRHDSGINFSPSYRHIISINHVISLVHSNHVYDICSTVCFFFAFPSCLHHLFTVATKQTPAYTSLLGRKIEKQQTLSIYITNVNRLMSVKRDLRVRITDAKDRDTKSRLQRGIERGVFLNYIYSSWLFQNNISFKNYHTQKEGKKARQLHTNKLPTCS